jgi:hypothetical protein
MAMKEANNNEEVKEKILDERCDNCGGRLKQYPIQKDGEPAGGGVCCPNYWREGGRWENCQEVVREI